MYQGATKLELFIHKHLTKGVKIEFNEFYIEKMVSPRRSSETLIRWGYDIVYPIPSKIEL